MCAMIADRNTGLGDKITIPLSAPVRDSVFVCVLKTVTGSSHVKFSGQIRVSRKITSRSLCYFCAVDVTVSSQTGGC